MVKTQLDTGLDKNIAEPEERARIERYINLKLASLGLPVAEAIQSQDLEIAHDLIEHYIEKNRLLAGYQCPVDARIQAYLDDLLDGVLSEKPTIPTQTVILDRYGIARTLSLPPDKDEYITDIVESYRVKQGVLHNPKHDRRTTKGSFHVAEGGLPVPPDKKSVPLEAYGRLLHKAFDPPHDLMELPFTSNQDNCARTLVSLLLKPMVSPEVSGYSNRKYMEVRFIAPGNLVSNLDFVESIFGNAGDPYLPENDSGIDPEHWTGHTGMAVLAPHLLKMTKKELGLPHIKDANERQKRDGMCWEKPDELYNGGQPFKITSRDDRGVIVTIIADNYFGYSKKEVKAQISYSANLSGMYEEEHAGGALAFASYNLGVRFLPDSLTKTNGQRFKDVVRVMGDNIDVFPEGYAQDKHYPGVFYLPEDARIYLDSQEAVWKHKGKEQRLRVLAGHVYLHPSGYKVRLEKHPATPSWRLVGTDAEGALCHKPCTVSGGGKSEISKSIWDAIQFGPMFIADFDSDMEQVEKIFNYDYTKRFDPETDLGSLPPEAFPRFPNAEKVLSKPNGLLDPSISLGFVINLLSPSSAWSDEYNQFIATIPNNITALVFLVKRFYRQSWGDDWKSHFSVDTINGVPGHEIRYAGRKLQGSYLRIGSREDGSGWTFKLRQDCMPADKVQWEDDISASIVVPANQIEHLNPIFTNQSVKFVENCEYRLFQRPDDAIHRGYDKQTEYDMSRNGNFICNFAPLKSSEARDMVENAVTFTDYTSPMQKFIKKAASEKDDRYFVASSHPRIVDGLPTKNPRYLQMNPNLVRPRDRYLADVSVRLARLVPYNKPVHHPVNAVLPGRRNNPVDHKAGIRPLAVYNPIHFQELPELFMDFVASLTGKSPSTTGAGSEGPLTKGPFNALVPTSDLNNALLSYILTGYNAFTTAAGYIGHKFKVDHDISLLIPEIWCRMTPDELDPKRLISLGYMEAISDFEHKGKKVPASRLGYRITQDFCNAYLGRIFDHPETVFSEEMLKPELQNLDDYVDGIANIVEAQQKVAQSFLDDGSVEAAIPPLKALLYIMATGSYEGKDEHDPEIRRLFDRDYVISSDWYQNRLELQQKSRVDMYNKHIAYLKDFLKRERHEDEVYRLKIHERIRLAEQHLARVSSSDFLDSIQGTIGLDPLYRA
ncbi:hypothetical protein [Spirochaeta dissipatitropha]